MGQWAGMAQRQLGLLLQFSIITAQKVLLSASRPSILLWQKHMGDIDLDL